MEVYINKLNYEEKGDKSHWSSNKVNYTANWIEFF